MCNQPARVGSINNTVRSAFLIVRKEKENLSVRCPSLSPVLFTLFLIIGGGGEQQKSSLSSLLTHPKKEKNH